MKRQIVPWAGVVLALLGGCSSFTRPQAIPGDPAFAPVPPQAMMAREPVSGSIFQVNRNLNPYGDRVALNIGDILTVRLEERTSSSKSARTNTSKNSEVEFNEASILGTSVGLKNLSLLTNPSMERSFNGTAGSNQSNSLAGSITVTVVEVLPNGVLRIRGEKWLSLNQGDEYVRLTGLVRPEDISPDNSLSSTKIADARIAYGGTGEFDQSNRMGWLARFFNSEWWPL